MKGICLTFHDSAIWNFFNTAYPIFQRSYPNWKGTYYMDRWATQTATVKNQMIAAQAAGIEIGNSTEQTASTYLATNTEQEFYDNIVAKNASDMVAGGIAAPTSFTLNTGEGPRTLIDLILAQGGSTALVFKKTGGILNSVGNGNGFYRNIYGGIARLDGNIDVQRSSFNEDYLISQLAYCKANNDVIIYACHAVEVSATQSLTTLYSTLHKLSRYCMCNGLSFYTVNDLINAGFVGTESAKPYSSLIVVSGTQSVGNALTAVVTYADEDDTAQSGSTYQWYRADDANGTNAAAIGGATALAYTLVAGDSGKYVRFGWIPRTASQTGYETFTKWYAIA